MRWLGAWLLLGLLVLTGSSSAQTDALRLAFLTSDEMGIQRIWLSDLAGDAQPLSQNSVSIYYYDVHPQGQAIVYANRDRPGGPSDLLELALTDNTMRVLLSCAIDDLDCREPVYSPNGALIAFEQMFIPADRAPDPPQIMLLERDNGAQQHIAEGRDPFWLSDGRLAYYDADLLATRIWVYDLQSATAQPYDLPDGGTVAFAPDSQRRLYSVVPHASSPSYRQMLIGTDSRAGRPLLPEDPAYSDEAALWHPAGRRILLQSLPLLEESSGYQFFWVWPGQNRRVALLPDLSQAHLQPRFSPDGAYLAFTRSTAARNLQVWVYELSSGQSWVLASGDQARWITIPVMQQSASE